MRRCGFAFLKTDRILEIPRCWSVCCPLTVPWSSHWECSCKSFLVTAGRRILVVVRPSCGFSFFFVRVLPCRVYTWSNSLESRDLSLSASLDLSLKKWALPKDVEILLGHVGLFPRYLMAVTVICTLAVAVVFFTSYNWLLKPRIEGEHNLPPLLHFTKNVASHLVAFRCRVECLSSPEPPAQVLKRRQLNSLEHQSVAVQPCGTHEST